MNHWSTPQQPNTSSPLAAALESPLGGQLYFSVTQVQRLLEQRIGQALKKFGLDSRQYFTLGLLAQGYIPAQHELGQVLGIDPSQVVTLVRGLVDRELVARVRRAEDRRITAIQATSTGQRLFQRATSAVELVEDEVTASLSSRDRNSLAALLERLVPLSSKES